MDNLNQDPLPDEQPKPVSPDTGAVSGSPNMEPDTTGDGYGNGDTMGNNDGTVPDPERTDLAANHVGAQGHS